MQNKTFCGGTDLSAVAEASLHALTYRFIKIGIIQHHKHVVATQLQRRFLKMLTGLLSHGAASALGSGQGDTLHPVVSNQSGDLIGGDEQVSPGPFRRTRFTNQLLKDIGTVRHDIGMFCQHRVTQRQIRCQHAHQLIVREIPRLDGN